MQSLTGLYFIKPGSPAVTGQIKSPLDGARYLIEIFPLRQLEPAQEADILTWRLFPTERAWRRAFTP
jgi:hypothetical protein